VFTTQIIIDVLYICDDWKLFVEDRYDYVDRRVCLQFAYGLYTKLNNLLL